MITAPAIEMPVLTDVLTVRSFVANELERVSLEEIASDVLELDQAGRLDVSREDRDGEE